MFSARFVARAGVSAIAVGGCGAISHAHEDAGVVLVLTTATHSPRSQRRRDNADANEAFFEAGGWATPTCMPAARPLATMPAAPRRLLARDTQDVETLQRMLDDGADLEEAAHALTEDGGSVEATRKTIALWLLSGVIAR